MKRQAAVKNLHRFVDNCAQLNRPPDEPIALEAYVFGDILEPGVDTIELVEVAIVLDQPAHDVPWQALPPGHNGLVHTLELEKIPVSCYWRPAEWPVWNHVIDRPVRVWSHESGTDDDAISALARAAAEPYRIPAPSAAEAATQREIERDAGLAYLRAIVDSYHEPGWRRDHKRLGIYPEDHLWNAAYGYLDLL